MLRTYGLLTTTNRWMMQTVPYNKIEAFYDGSLFMEWEEDDEMRKVEVLRGKKVPKLKK